MWRVQSDSKPQEQKENLLKAKRRLEELDRLISGLYENFVSGLLPQKQYKSLMQKYSDEQTALENRTAEIENEMKETKVSSVEIGRFIKLIKKYKEPTELTTKMTCELIDKIVVHEAIGKKPNRQQQVDIYYNFIGQLDLPLSEKEIAEARQKAEQEAAEKAKRSSVRAMLHIKPKQRRNAGRRMTGISTRSVSANSAVRSFIRTAQGRGFAILTAQKPISRQKKRRNALPKRESTPSVKRSARYAASPSGRPTVRRCYAPRNAKPSIATKDSLPIITVSNPCRKPEKQYYNSRRTTQWRNLLQTKGQACVMSLSGTTT